MRTAKQIMRSKRFIKKEMDRYLPGKQSDALWKRSTERLAELLERYAYLPKAVHGHTDRYIFPSAAIYLCAKEELGGNVAYRIIEDAAVSMTTAAGEKLSALMRLPGMSDLFVQMWDPMTKKMFGPDNGFKNVFYSNRKGEFRMDIISCPYCRYFAELGCPELTKIYCANDNRVYGNLPGLEFIRTGTLGTGAERCDFYLRKV